MFFIGIPPVAPIVTAMNTAPLVFTGPVSPVGSVGSIGAPAAPPVAGPGATSTPRASVSSLERTASIESGS